MVPHWPSGSRFDGDEPFVCTSAGGETTYWNFLSPWPTVTSQGKASRPRRSAVVENSNASQGRQPSAHTMQKTDEAAPTTCAQPKPMPPRSVDTLVAAAQRSE